MSSSADDVIEKIKKAIRLARRTTSEAERDTAMRLAKTIADRNGIALDGIERESEAGDRATVEYDDCETSGFTGVEFGHALYILDRHFAVSVMIMQNPSRSWMKKGIWFGSRLNIAIARYVCNILLRESRKAWNEAVATDRRMKRTMYSQQTRKLDRQAFMSGFFWSIDQKLRANPLRNDLVAERAATSRKVLEFKQRNETVPMRQRKSRNEDANAVYQGMLAGQSINLSRPCEGRATESHMIAGSPMAAAIE